MKSKKVKLPLWLEKKTSGMTLEQKEKYCIEVLGEIFIYCRMITEYEKMKDRLPPEVASIIKTMLQRLKSIPFDGRTKAAILMFDDETLMAGHREEVERFFLSNYYWNQ